MKKLIYTFAFTLSAMTIFAQAGVLDNTFGTKGVKIIGGESVNILNNSLSINVGNDGKAVIIQNANQSLDTPSFFVKRLLPNGNLDATFGSGGTIKLGGDKDFLYLSGVKVTKDSKILLYGFGAANASQTLAKALVIRLNSNGTFDNTFGTNGKTFITSPGVADFVMHLQEQTDGKILLIGSLNSTTGMVIRMNTNGTLDNSFAQNGIFSFEPQNTKGLFLFEGHLDKQGNIFVLGNKLSLTDTTEDFIIKLSSTGSIITTGFGTNGIATIPTTSDMYLINCALQNNGKFIIGYNIASAAGITSSGLMRFNANGTLDNTFGTQGKLVTSTNTSSFHQELNAVKTMANDKIIINTVGYDDNADALSFLMVNRYLPNGVKDNEFGQSGTVLIESDSLITSVSAITIQENTNTIFVYTQAENEDEEYYNIIAKILNPFGVSTQENIQINNFKVFPTVVESVTNVSYELEKDEKISIQLIDNQGKIIAEYLNQQNQSAGKYTQSIILPNSLTSGVYFITLNNSKGCLTEKIIK